LIYCLYHQITRSPCQSKS